MKEREVLTTAQAADFLQVHPKVLGRYIKSRGLPAHRIGREYRFLKSELVVWVASDDLREVR